MYASPAASIDPLVSVSGQTLHQAHAQAHAKLATGISELCRQATGCTGWLLTNGLNLEQLMHPAEGAQQAQGLSMALGKQEWPLRQAARWCLHGLLVGEALSCPPGELIKGCVQPIQHADHLHTHSLTRGEAHSTAEGQTDSCCHAVPGPGQPTGRRSGQPTAGGGNRGLSHPQTGPSRGFTVYT